MIASQYHRCFTGLVHFKLYLLLYINYILNFHITIIIWQIKIFEYYLSKLSSSSSPSEAVVHCCPRPHSFRFSCVLPEDRDRNDDNWVERSPWWKPWSCTACTAGIGGGSCGSHRSWCPADSSSPWVRMVWEDDDDENFKFSSNLPEIVSSEKVGILFGVLSLGGWFSHCCTSTTFSTRSSFGEKVVSKYSWQTAK